MNHLHLLVPSWRFFDRFEVPPLLEMELANGSWVPVLKKPTKRGLLGLFFNPAGNAYLAAQSWVERACDGTAEATQFVERLVAYEAAQRNVQAIGFRIKVGDDVVIISKGPGDAS